MTRDDIRPPHSAARVLGVVSLLSAAIIVQACGSDANADRALDGTGNKTNAGSGGTMSPHITPGGAGTGGSSARSGAGGSPVSTGGAGSGAAGDGDAAGASGHRDPPGPTGEGRSPYTLYCDDSTPCGDSTAVSCLHVLLDEGTRSACSNDCDSTGDCSDASSGTDANAQCVQFTSAKHCVLVCYDAGVESRCPDGMGCFRYQASPVGYCLWP